MASLSFVVAAYNVENYIARCLDSLCSQNGDDIEIVVVDDASTDGTAKILRDYAIRDARIHIISKPINEGTHLARKTGVSHTSGDYVIFVDGDDELELSAAEVLLEYAQKRQFDILRFGRSVIPENGVSQGSAWAEEASFNKVYREQRGEDIIRSVFSDAQPFRQSWSLIDCMFAGSFARKMFAEMIGQPLGRMQDSYEFFVLAASAQVMLGISEIRALRYHFGTGVSGTNSESIQRFCRGQQGIHASAQAVLDFAAASNSQTLSLCARWYEKTVLGIIGRDWSGRLTEDEQIAAVESIRETWGDEDAAGIVLEPLLPRARFVDEDGGIPDESDPYVRWSKALRQLDLSAVTDSDIACRLSEYRQIAAKIECREQKQLQRELQRELQRRIEQMRREQERQLQEQESHRLFKSGSLLRKALDSVCPEGSRLRNALRSAAHLILRR